MKTVNAGFALIVFSRYHVTSLQCLEHMLNLTQSCSNPVVEVGAVGLSHNKNGLGSEFNHWLLYDFLEAFYKGKRMVFQEPKPAFGWVHHSYESGWERTTTGWEYDCPDHLGWACYFDIPCIDAFQDPIEDPFTVEKLYHKDFIDQWKTNSLQKLYDDQRKPNDPHCNFNSIKLDTVMSLASNYLFKLNKFTSTFVTVYNTIYGIPEGSPYAALHLRNTDKKGEVSIAEWSWINDMEKVYSVVKPYLVSSGIKYLFVATDNCELLQKLIPLLESHIHVSSPCMVAGKVNPRQRTYVSTLQLFAEIEMFRSAQHFFGTLLSNLPRLVYRLKYPNNADTTHDISPQFHPDMSFDNFFLSRF